MCVGLLGEGDREGQKTTAARLPYRRLSGAGRAEFSSRLQVVKDEVEQ